MVVNIVGTNDSENLIGGEDDNLIQGLAGNDYLFGSNGADTLVGGLGNDSLRGGDGNDVFVHNQGDGHDEVSEGVFQGEDTLLLSGNLLTSTNVTLTRIGNANDVLLTFNGSDDSIRVEDGLSSFSHIEYITFSDGVTWDRDTLRIKYLAAAGTAGDDRIAGFDLNETIRGGLGNDTLIGGSANDVFLFAQGDGQDILNDSNGDDSLIFSGAALTVSNLLLARADTLDLKLSFKGTTDSITLTNEFSGNGAGNIDHITFSDGQVWDVATLRSYYISHAATTGNDIISGFQFLNDTLSGGLGDDFLDGLWGNDTYLYNQGDGKDFINETAFSGTLDTLLLSGAALTSNKVQVARPGGVGSTVVLTFDGVADSIALAGGFGEGNRQDGVEVISFSDGVTWGTSDLRARYLATVATNSNDVIIGFEGNDTLSGGLGNDSLNGGGGNDTFIYRQGDGKDTIVQGFEFFQNSDTLMFTGAALTSNNVRFVRDGSGSDLTLTFAGVADSVTLQRQLNNTSNNSGIEQISFSDNVTWNLATLKQNILNASSTANDDSIFGFLDSNETLVGGLGNDTLNGLRGNDTYLHAKGDGQDTIIEVSSDFGGGEDSLIFSGTGLSSGNAIITRISNSNDLKISFNGSADTVTLAGQLNVDDHGNGIESITFSDNVTLSKTALISRYLATLATAGNDTVNGFDRIDDTIVGGLGNDSLNGQGGRDTYLHAQGEGQDTIAEVRGDEDTLIFSGSALTSKNVHLVRNAKSNDVTLTFTGVTDSVTLLDQFADDSILWGKTVENITFSDNVTWHVKDLREKFLADSVTIGDDTIFGFASSNDVIRGSSGNDAIFGLAGSDTIDGGAGQDIAVIEGKIGDRFLNYFDGAITVTTILQGGLQDNDRISNVEILRFDDRDLAVPDGLRYIASHGDLINAFHGNIEAGLNHYFAHGYKEGRQATFDAQVYINKYADVRALYGSDLSAATLHYINAGFDNGRSDSLISADNLSGTVNADVIWGYGGSDTIDGGNGNDTIDAGLGNDTVIGGQGIDVSNYAGNYSDYSFSYRNGVLSIEDKNLANGNEGIDSLHGIEVLHFANRDVTIPDGLRYIASNPGLIPVFGSNANAGIEHYLNFGLKEGRQVTFDAQVYLNKYADVRATADSDLNAATLHFITSGHNAGRSDSQTSADNLSGTAGVDNIFAYGGNDTVTGAAGNDMVDGGTGADTVNYAGNFSDYGFTFRAGVLTVQDKNLANGNEGTDSLSNVEVLHFANRDVIIPDGLRYIASNPGLIPVFGSNAASGVEHYLNFGLNEGRQVTFDAQVYLNKYADVRAAVGSNLSAATLNFVTSGHNAGRSDSQFSADNLSGTAGSDNISAYGGNDTITGAAGNDTVDGGTGTDTANYTGNFADYGFTFRAGVLTVQDKNLSNGNEGTDSLSNVEVLHFANRDVIIPDGLRYIASNPGLIPVFGSNAAAGVEHYLNFGLNEGRQVTFDAQVYLNKYADVRAAVGSDLSAATLHFITSGFGRSDSLTTADNLFGTVGADNISAYGGNDTIGGGAGNDVIDGGSGTDTAYVTGNFSDYGFTFRAGVLTVQDKNLTNGNDGTDSLSNVEVLQFANRDVIIPDGLRYIASNPGLIPVFGGNAAAGVEHYLNYGLSEGRLVSFNAQAYLNKYADVRAAVGSDLSAATLHFITSGFNAGRIDRGGRNENLVGTAGNDNIITDGLNDTITSGAGNDTIDGGGSTDVDTINYAGNFADFSFSSINGVLTVRDNNLANGDEGIDSLVNIERLHFADRDVAIEGLRYIASNPGLIPLFRDNADAGVDHYLRFGLNEGRQVTFDAAAYLGRYADLRGAFGNDQLAATRHFINFGHAEGRIDRLPVSGITVSESALEVSLVGMNLENIVG